MDNNNGFDNRDQNQSGDYSHNQSTQGNDFNNRSDYNDPSSYHSQYGPNGYNNQYDNNFDRYGRQEKTPGLAIAGLVCGIVGFFWYGFILGTLALIFGAVSRSKCPPGRTGMSTAAIVLGVVDIIGWVLILCLCSWALPFMW